MFIFKKTLNMKNIRKILNILFVQMLVLSCAEDKIPTGAQLADVPYFITVDKTSLDFAASQNSSAKIEITSQNVAWEITGVPDWLTLSATKGTGNATVKVTANENKQVDDSRVAVLNVESTSSNFQFSKNVTVSQAAAAAYIKVGMEAVSVLPQEVVESVAVDSNVEWVAVCYSSWITLTKTNNTILQISVSENLTAASRTATIALRRVGSTATLATISVTQSEGGVTGSTEEVKFGIEGGTKSVEIDADVTWNAVSSASSWLSVTPRSGIAGKAVLKLTALANGSTSSRNAFVYVKIGGTQKLSIPVLQEGISFNVNGMLHEFSASGNESQKLSIITNKEWKVLAKPDWVTVTPAEGGKGTTEVDVKVVENVSLNSRSATLRIGIEGLNIYKDIAVSQSGLDSEFSGSTLEFGWESSQKDIEVVVPNSWSATVSKNWITLSQYSGNGGETVHVTVQTNDNEDARTGTIAVVTEGNTFVFSVVQQGQYLKINSVAGEFAAMGGTASLEISTTVGAEYSIEYEGAVKDWLSAKDDGGDKYTLTAIYNPSVNPRVAQFVIKPTMNVTNSACTQGVKFAVSQKGRSLSSSVSEILLFAKGGSTETYAITADGNYNIAKPDSDSWYTIQHDSNTATFSIAASENSTGADRTSRITISLTDLPDGEEKSIVIDVVQNTEDFIVDVDGWGDDHNWD